MKPALKKFYGVNAIIIALLTLEHFVSNVWIDNILSALKLSEPFVTLASVGSIILWIIALALWWKYIKRNHGLVKKNLFPLMMLAVFAAIFIADIILISFQLVPSFSLCVPTATQYDQMTGAQIGEFSERIMKEYEEAQVCGGELFTIHYSFLVELPFYGIILLIALISYIRGRKKNIIDMKKEELFQ